MNSIFISVLIVVPICYCLSNFDESKTQRTEIDQNWINELLFPAKSANKSDIKYIPASATIDTSENSYDYKSSSEHCIDEDDEKENKKPIPKRASNKHDEWNDEKYLKNSRIKRSDSHLSDELSNQMKERIVRSISNIDSNNLLEKNDDENLADFFQQLSKFQHIIQKFLRSILNSNPVPTNYHDIKDLALEKLTKKDNFNGRFFTQNFGVVKITLADQLKKLEDLELKLTQLISQTAMADELIPLLSKLDNFPLQCPYNVASIKVGSFCYTIELIHLNFDKAKRFCEARGGLLAQEPFTQEIWNKIIMGYPDFQAGKMWLGATDNAFEGTFTFFNGKTISSLDSRWSVGSPSISTARNCLAMAEKQTVTFTDIYCHSKLHFICQYNLTTLIDSTNTGKLLHKLY